MEQRSDTAAKAGDADAQQTEQMAKLVEGRGATYGLLARLYRKEVDADLLKQLKGMRFPASSGDKDIDEGYRRIATFLSNAWENTLTDLAVDYTRTFIGHGNDAYSAAYPFESVYTSEKRLLMQAARDEVLAIYRSEGLDKQSSWKEGEDHVAVELEFMQVLCERAAKALRDGDEDRAVRLLSTQRNFLHDHLAAWAPMMTKDMRKFAKTGLYQGLAYLTDGFLRSDREFLDDLVGDDAADASADEEPEKAEGGEE